MGCGPSSTVSPAVDAKFQNNKIKNKPGNTFQPTKADEALNINKKYMGVFVGCLLIRCAIPLSDIVDFATI